MKFKKRYLILFLLLFNFNLLSIKASPGPGSPEEGMKLYLIEEKVGTYEKTKEKVESGESVLLCDYGDNDNNKTRIYLNFKKQNPEPNKDLDFEIWNIFHSKGETLDFQHLKWGELQSYGYFGKVFNGQLIHYNKTSGKLKSVDNFTCPKYSYLDTDGTQEICFAKSDKNWECQIDFETSKEPLKENKETIFYVINNYITKGFFEEILTTKTVIKSDLKLLMFDKLDEFINTKYNFNNLYVKPIFISNYITSMKNNKINIELDEDYYSQFIEKYKSMLEELNKNGLITQDELNESMEYLPDNLYDSIGGTGSGGIPHLPPSSGDDCQSILTPLMAETVQNILNFIQFLGPVIVAVLTIKDFIMASLNGDQEVLKKTVEKFKKRLIAAILLFFLPILVNLILGLTGIIPPSSCIE